MFVGDQNPLGIQYERDGKGKSERCKKVWKVIDDNGESFFMASSCLIKINHHHDHFSSLIHLYISLLLLKFILKHYSL